MLRFVMMSSQIPTLARGGGVGVSIDKCISNSYLSIYLKTKQKKTAKQISKQDKTKKKKKEEGKKKVVSKI